MKYDVAIIPCTSRKNPTGVTAASLYMGGPFAMMMRHARQRAVAILVMSAKYGLVTLTEPISWYEAYLPALSPADRRQLLARLGPQLELLRGQQILWYPSAAYYAAALEANPEVAVTIHRPYRKLGSLRLYKVLSNETQNYGTYPPRR